MRITLAEFICDARTITFFIGSWTKAFHERRSLLGGGRYAYGWTEEYFIEVLWRRFTLRRREYRNESAAAMLARLQEADDE